MSGPAATAPTRAGSERGAAAGGPQRNEKVEPPLPDRLADGTHPWIRQAGGMFLMTRRAVGQAFKPPFDYAPELVTQFRFMLKISFLPMLLTSFALSFGPAGIQASNFFSLFGALDRMGAAYVLIVIREFAPLVTAIILAGVAGTAICSDLGARRIREELSALEVLGIDPVKYLVLPRLLALIGLAFLFNVFSIIAGLLGAAVVLIQNDAPFGPFFATFFSNATTVELAGSMLKCLIFGTMIAIFACYKGMNASGGAEGVGRAVNQSVTLAFLALIFVNYFYTQLMLASFPILSEVRG